MNVQLKNMSDKIDHQLRKCPPFVKEGQGRFEASCSICFFESLLSSLWPKGGTNSNAQRIKTRSGFHNETFDDCFLTTLPKTIYRLTGQSIVKMPIRFVISHQAAA